MVEDNNIELETNVETNNIELEGTISEVGPKGEKGDAGIQGPPGISPKVSFEKINKVLKITIEDYEGKHIAYLNDGKDGTGSGDMQKEIYDTDNDGVIDNAQKVNNHIVKSDVPENAKFTDTIYDDTNLKKLISNLNNIKADKSNLEQKVDKIHGKFLSSNDYTDEEKIKLNSLKPIDFDKTNNEVQFKVGEEKVYPNIKREFVSATKTPQLLGSPFLDMTWEKPKTTTNKISCEINGIRIKKGVKKILLSAQLFGENMNAGYFFGYIKKNAEIISEYIEDSMGSSFSAIPITPICIEVKENDFIHLNFQYNNPTAGRVRSGYIFVEVIE